MRPVVAIYSTFLQRAFDQTVHDVCQNDQPVLLAVDRAGLVGEDGTSHQGMFTLPAQRQLPNLVIAQPEGRAGAPLAAPDRARPGPPVRPALPARPGLRPAAASIRRSCRSAEARSSARAATSCRRLRADRRPGLAAADALAADGWSVEVINARFAKPLDGELILDEARGKQLVVTLEESVVSGGFGSGRPRAARRGAPRRPAPIAMSRSRSSGIPADRFVDHGSVSDLRRLLRLDAAGIAAQIRETLAALGLGSPGVAPTGEHPRA